ncbi:MAG: EAL domain-containing protein [Fusobacteriaceae bacterium]|nr:EAL domain-containing protein [Fusobacteriaceae bacterium]
MWKKIKIEKILLTSMIFAIGIIINIYIWYYISVQNRKDIIDSKLMYAASNIENLLPKDFHNKKMEKDDYYFDKLYRVFTRMDIEAKKMGVDYIYTFIKKKNEIYYTSLSGNDEEVREDSNAYYFHPLKNTNDSSYNIISSIFDNPRIEFVDSKDQWGEYHSVFMPKTSGDGTFYISGADISKKNMYMELSKFLYLIMFSVSSIIILSIPLISAFKIYKKNNDRGLLDLIEYDKFTGVYKREVGFSFLEDCIRLYEMYNIEFAIFIVDINGLKIVNSKEGLKNGDALIKVLANILKQLNKDDIVFRLNDDDFIVINTRFTDIRETDFLNRLINKVKYFNHHNKRNLYLRLHVVLMKYENQGLDNFIEAAMERLAEAKKKGDYQEATIQYRIKEGLKKEEFFVCYQPKVNVINNKVSFEALIRWKNENGLIVPPDDFIPIAEKSYLIFLLTEFVLDEVLKNIEKYKLEISLNISPIILEKNSFLLHIFEKIKKFEFKDYLTLEITEGVALRNLENTIDKIKKFNEIGVKFSMDDFGTGYSSLSNLNILPMSEVKVDKSFVQMIEERPENRIIIEMIVKLGDVLGFEIVAEGVENIEHLTILKTLGCYIYQGYYFDKAIPIEEVLEKLENNSYFKKIE